MIPLSSTFSYFCASLPWGEEDMRDYLEEPISALPPAISAQLPRTSILLVPYISKGKPGDIVSMEKPPEDKLAYTAQVKSGDETILAFGLKGQEVAEYHYRFYNQLATMIADRSMKPGAPKELNLPKFSGLIHDELIGEVHGEVDEESWRSKQALVRRAGKVRTEGKPFWTYVRHSFIDSLTLYLHGICCDIDVDAGPRQLPSRFLRKRLVALREYFPPPAGFAVLPEDMK
ncbi:MAG TPA: hypothetical protein VGL53_23785 [Bryobacteraceae bacterium]|jgi:hypothetical protein